MDPRELVLLGLEDGSTALTLTPPGEPANINQTIVAFTVLADRDLIYAVSNEVARHQARTLRPTPEYESPRAKSPGAAYRNGDSIEDDTPDHSDPPGGQG